jgi:hypothetical protein
MIKFCGAAVVNTPLYYKFVGHELGCARGRVTTVFASGTGACRKY